MRVYYGRSGVGVGGGFACVVVGEWLKIQHQIGRGLGPWIFSWLGCVLW
jgi:hypothetical protein